MNHGDDYAEMAHFHRAADGVPLSSWRTKTLLRTRLHDARNALRQIMETMSTSLRDSPIISWMSAQERIPAPIRLAQDYFPYLYWARSTYFSHPQYSMLTASYPLSWEQHGSLSHPQRMAAIDPAAPKLQMSYPHSWTAAEMFLNLYAYNLAARR